MRAACVIRDAAEAMNRAANNVDSVLERNRNIMDDWLQRLDLAIKLSPFAALVGKECRCEFKRPAPHKISTMSTWVTVVNVDMPMVELKDKYHEAVWVNVDIIQTIEVIK